MNDKLCILFAFIVWSGCSTRLHQSDRFYEFGGRRYRIHEGIHTVKHGDIIYAIDLTKDSLKSLPKELEDLSQLMFLNLRDNQLSSLDESLCRLTKLKVLLIDRNTIESLPDCVYDMKQLEIVTLFGCKMDISKEGFAKLSNLRILGMGGNNFVEEDLIYLRRHLPNCNIIVSVD